MITVERSERHREGPSGKIRAERYPTVILAPNHEKTVSALWALETQRSARTKPQSLSNSENYNDARLLSIISNCELDLMLH